MLSFCTIIAYFGFFFMASLAYMVHIKMPFIKFKMDDPLQTETALITVSLIYLCLAILFSGYLCLRKQNVPIYKIYNPRRI